MKRLPVLVFLQHSGFNNTQPIPLRNVARPCRPSISHSAICPFSKRFILHEFYHELHTILPLCFKCPGSPCHTQNSSHHLNKTFLEDAATVPFELPLVPGLRHLPIYPPAINLAKISRCSPAESSFRCPGSEIEHQRDAVELSFYFSHHGLAILMRRRALLPSITKS